MTGRRNNAHRIILICLNLIALTGVNLTIYFGIKHLVEYDMVYLLFPVILLLALVIILVLHKTGRKTRN